MQNGGMAVRSDTIQNDYSTDQQVEALNWFFSILAKNNWDASAKITVSGHSKGGNKAQFVAINSDFVHNCYSFDGQGFSPEALASLKIQYGKEYENRREKIYSFSTDNDYVNVLGQRLVPFYNIYYFKAHSGLHYMEAMVGSDGKFTSPAPQGKLSLYVESVSEKLMNLKPSVRQYATLGVMNIFQKYLGDEEIQVKDALSVEKTLAGLGIAVGSLIHQFCKG